MDEQKVKRLVAAGELIRFRGEVKRMVFDNSSSGWVDMLIHNGRFRSSSPDGSAGFVMETVSRKRYSQEVSFRVSGYRFAYQKFEFSAIGFDGDFQSELVIVAPTTASDVLPSRALYYEAGPERYGVFDFGSRFVCEQAMFRKSDRWCEYGPEDIGMLCLLDEVALCEMHAPMYLIHKSEVDQVF